MDDFKTRSLKGFIWNHLTKLLDYGLVYLISVILARYLNPVDYGIFVTVYGLGTALIIITSVGIDETINKFVSQLYTKKKFGQIKGLILYLLKVRFLILFFCLIIIYFLRHEISILFNKKELSFYITIIIFFIFFQNLSNFFINYFTALLKTRLTFFINSSLKILLFLLIVYYIEFSNNISVIFFIIASVSLISFCVYLLFVRKIFSYKKEYIKTNVITNFFLIMWLNAILSMIIGRYSDIFLIGYLLGVNEQISRYEIAFSLVTAMDYLFSVGLVGVIVSVFSTMDIISRDKIISTRNKIIKYYQFFVMPLMVFAIIFAGKIIKFIYTNQYDSAVPLFETFLSYKVIIVGFLGSGLNVSILVSLGKQKYVLLNRVILGLINLLLNIAIIPFFGAWGAIFITGLIQLFIYLIDFILVSKIVGYNYDYRFLIKSLIIICSALSIIYLLNLLLDLSIIILLCLFLVNIIVLYIIFNKGMIEEVKNNFQLFFRKV